MSNKTELQANNVELQEILDSVNALPDAGGGGGSAETCTLAFRGAAPSNIIYTTADETGIHTQISLSAVVHSGLVVTCNSYIGVIGNSINVLADSLILDGAELVSQQLHHGAIFKITAMPGQNSSIIVEGGT